MPLSPQPKNTPENRTWSEIMQVTQANDDQRLLDSCNCLDCRTRRDEDEDYIDYDSDD